jgi:hypothetical protein
MQLRHSISTALAATLALSFIQSAFKAASPIQVQPAIAAFSPAPKHPPKVTSGTGTRHTAKEPIVISQAASDEPIPVPDCNVKVGPLPPHCPPRKTADD